MATAIILSPAPGTTWLVVKNRKGSSKMPSMISTSGTHCGKAMPQHKSMPAASDVSRAMTISSTPPAISGVYSLGMRASIWKTYAAS
jgi:hypothetical protein